MNRVLVAAVFAATCVGSGNVFASGAIAHRLGQPTMSFDAEKSCVTVDSVLYRRRGEVELPPISKSDTCHVYKIKVVGYDTSILLGDSVGKTTSSEYYNVTGVRAFVQVLRDAGDEGATILAAGLMSLDQYKKFLWQAIQRASDNGDIARALHQGNEFARLRCCESMKQRDVLNDIIVESALFLKFANQWFLHGHCWEDETMDFRIDPLLATTDVIVKQWLRMTPAERRIASEAK